MKKISNTNKKITAILFSIVISVFCIAWKAVPQRDFVLFVYMNGSNLESKYQLGTDNIENMLQAMAADGPDDHFTIVLLMGGTQKWHLDKNISPWEIPTDSIVYAQITHKGFKKIHSLEKRSIGDQRTLTEFINYGMKEFPANKYGLVFWNHGAGSVTGFGYDELYPDNTSLSLAEIRDGLQEAYSLNQRKFAFIGFDACLMATLETASAVSPYADYLVASQELEPGKGWNYKSITEALCHNPEIADDKLCRLIVDSFVESYQEKEEEQVTLSVTDLSKIHALSANIGELSARVRQRLTDEDDAVNPLFYKKLSDLRTEAKSFGMPSFTYYGPDMVDAWDFCRNICKETNDPLAEKIKSNIQESIIYSKKSGNLEKENICGLSVYFPCYNLDVAKNLTEYHRCGFNEAYLDLVKAFADRLLIGNSEEKVTKIVQNDSTMLSTEMLLKIRKAYSIVLGAEGDKWITYGLDGDGVTLDHDGRIIKKHPDGSTMDKWDMKWINIGGKTVSAYMALANKNALVYTVPVYLNNELTDLIVRYDNDNPSGKVCGARRITDNQIPDKGMIEIKANDTIIPLHERFDKDEFIEYIPSNDTIIIRKKKDVKVRLDTVPEGKYRYGYCLVDLYGRKYYTRFTDYKVE